MNLAEKLAILADAAKYDASCSSSGSGKVKRGEAGKGIGSTEGMGICHSYTPDGRCVSLLKILLTNFCIFDCKYCVNRVSSDVPRARFTPDEVITLTLDFYKRNYIEGLFLSSGIIKDADYTMEQITRVAKELRETHHFRGYIHLKTIPGAKDELIREAGLYADRLSINIELPTPADLEALAPEKKRPELERNMDTVNNALIEFKEDKKKGMKVPLFAPAGQSTQMIVGATATADQQILATAASLYGDYKLRRVYYSAYSPIPHADARLPALKPPLMREHRLYQADWLLRFYGFSVNEITPVDAPNLDLEMDPKSAWALRNPHYFPVDINKAPREVLLRIPGIGARSVERILQMRRYYGLRMEDLARLRVALKRARPFVLTADANPMTALIGTPKLLQLLRPAPQQLSLGL